MRRIIRLACATALAVGTSAVALPITAAAPSAPVVPTAQGAVQGVRADGIDSFLGLRYAAPPTGELRWQPPQPAAPHAGVLVADHHRATCAAAESSNGPRTEAEDCLFLNVQRPAGLRAGERRPVLVFIHGGGFTNGSSNQYDAAPLVSATGAVVVTLNYRLGILGFLGHPGLTAEAGESGNYGLMDQQAALRWVRDNIAGFGGDPRQVTIGGESAGGMSVCAQLVAPGSRGLFQRAIIQSGGCASQTLPDAEEIGGRFADAVACADPATAVACLRATPVAALIDTPYPSEVGFGIPLPTSATSFLPEDPRDAVRNGQFARVPVLVGANRDEGRTFTADMIGAGEQDYRGLVEEIFGDTAPLVLQQYPWPADADEFTAAYLAGAIYTDHLAGIGGCENLALTEDLARRVPTWAYEFDHRTGPGLAPIPGYEWGAGHAAELPYLFPGFDNGTPIASTFDAAERRLAAEMKDRWGRFVTKGSATAALPGWPRFDRTGAVLALRAGGQSAVVPLDEVAAAHRCDFWSAAG